MECPECGGEMKSATLNIEQKGADNTILGAGLGALCGGVTGAIVGGLLGNTLTSEETTSIPVYQCSKCKGVFALTAKDEEN